MIELNGPGWSWGTDWQLWACRLSHLLGLMVVLGLLWFVGVVH